MTIFNKLYKALKDEANYIFRPKHPRDYKPYWTDSLNQEPKPFWGRVRNQVRIGFIRLDNGIYYFGKDFKEFFQDRTLDRIKYFFTGGGRNFKQHWYDTHVQPVLDESYEREKRDAETQAKLYEAIQREKALNEELRRAKEEYAERIEVRKTQLAMAQEVKELIKGADFYHIKIYVDKDVNNKTGVRFKYNPYNFLAKTYVDMIKNKLDECNKFAEEHLDPKLSKLSEALGIDKPTFAEKSILIMLYNAPLEGVSVSIDKSAQGNTRIISYKYKPWDVQAKEYVQTVNNEIDRYMYGYVTHKAGKETARVFTAQDRGKEKGFVERVEQESRSRSSSIGA